MILPMAESISAVTQILPVEVSGKPEYGHRFAVFARDPGFHSKDLWKTTQILEFTPRMCEVYKTLTYN